MDKERGVPAPVYTHLSFINQASDQYPCKLLLSKEKAFSKETAVLVMKKA